MNFSTKLNVVFKTLKIKNSVISQMSDVDASLISRFRSGARVPKPNSPQLHKMCVSVVDYIEETDRLPILNNICSFPSDLIGAPLVSALKVWLLNNEPIKNASLNVKTEETTPIFLSNFGAKLDNVMELLNLSNISLSKSLNVDPSLVSRFRNGTRTPSIKNSSIKDICAYLYDVAVEKKLLHQFYELIDINPAYLNDDREALIEYFVDWICDKKEMTQHAAISSFLYNLNFFTNNVAKTPSVNELIDTSLLDDKTTTFIGTEGLRMAINKLAANILSSAPSTVYIYTDQDLAWFNGDSKYSDRIISLFIKYLELGGNINLIHSMNHKPSDILFEIEKLMPLHATGQIHSYFHDDGASRRFSQTLIIAEGIGAVVASFVMGAEETSEYYYIVGDRINYYQNQFNIMLNSCKPLIQTIPAEYKSAKPDELLDITNDAHSRITLEYTLPTIGMSDKLFEEVLSCNRISDELKDEARKLFAERKKQNEFEGEFFDYLPLADISLLPSTEKMKSTDVSYVLHDTAYLMIPVNIGRVGVGTVDETSIFYTRELFVEHIRSIIKILSTNEDYRIVPVEYKTYRTLRLMLVKDRCIIACRNEVASTTFLFNHSIFNKPLEEYLYSLQSPKYSKIPTQEESIKYLENYIRFW